MAKKPFINKYGFVEYPFLHDDRKGKNWWFFNLLEDHLKRRSRKKLGPDYTKQDMHDDMLTFLHDTNLKFLGEIEKLKNWVNPVLPDARIGYLLQQALRSQTHLCRRNARSAAPTHELIEFQPLLFNFFL